MPEFQIYESEHAVRLQNDLLKRQLDEANADRNRLRAMVGEDPVQTVQIGAPQQAGGSFKTSNCTVTIGAPAGMGAVMPAQTLAARRASLQRPVERSAIAPRATIAQAGIAQAGDARIEDENTIDAIEIVQAQAAPAPAPAVTGPILSFAMQGERGVPVAAPAQARPRVTRPPRGRAPAAPAPQEAAPAPIATSQSEIEQDDTALRFSMIEMR
jgi:hypothetical protein